MIIFVINRFELDLRATGKLSAGSIAAGSIGYPRPDWLTPTNWQAFAARFAA
jgi:hypothetical protein